ncbi:MAG: hypothetical protein IT480_18285 [Gammaproteobacteria bacterium]|nr:hypothetical protein [Gammaproteobacteria bacterium]
MALRSLSFGRPGIGREALLAVAVLLGVVQAALAQDADTREVQRYVLTDAGLARYSQAWKNLAALPAPRKVRCDDGSSGTSISQLVAKMEATSGARAALQSAGMAAREYVVFSMSLLQNGLAAWAQSQPGGKLPAGVTQANVDFVRKHEAQLKQLETSKPKDPCADPADADGDSEGDSEE